MKIRKNIFGTPDPMAKADKVNNEGAPAFSGTLKMDVLSALMTGSTANTFYANRDAQFDNFSEIFAKISKEDPEWFSKAILFARREGFQRVIPIYALVHLSKEDVGRFKELYKDVVRNPQDAKNFLDILRSGRVRGIGRAIKSELNAHISRLTPYDAIKYPTNVRDMINLSRPRETTNKTIIDYIKKGDVGDNEILNGLKALKDANSSTRYMAIKDFNLPYESVTSQVGNDAMAWKALYEIAPHFNLIRNLRNFIEKGVADTDIGDRILKYKKGSMLFPFRYLSAYDAVKEIGGNRVTKGIALIALNECIQKAIDDLPDSDMKMVVGVDSSGSMSCTTTDGMCASRVANLFSSMMSMRYGAPIISFAESVKGVFKYKQGSVIEVANALPLATGGTSLASPIDHMLQGFVKADLFIGFTDNEEWCNGTFLASWRKYRARNPNAQAVLVQLIPTMNRPTPVNEPGVRYVYGWSDSVLKYIFTDMEKLIDEI